VDKIYPIVLARHDLKGERITSLATSQSVSSLIYREGGGIGRRNQKGRVMGQEKLRIASEDDCLVLRCGNYAW
jgi:hypothetical protein